MFAPSKIKRISKSGVRVAPFFNWSGVSSFFGKTDGKVDVTKPPVPGEMRPVISLKARIMSSPQFLGASVIMVRRGARVKVEKVAGSWCYVTYKMRRGWIHRNRIWKKKIRLSSGDTGTGTSRGEMEIGGRG